MQQANLQKVEILFVKTATQSKQLCLSLSLTGKVFPPPPVKINTTTASLPPLNLASWIMDNKQEIDKRGYKVLFFRGEFKVSSEIMSGSGDSFVCWVTR